MSTCSTLEVLDGAWLATELSIDNRGFEGLPKAGAAETGAS